MLISFGVGVIAGIFLVPKRSPKPKITLGFPDEWERFAARNPRFLQAIPLLFDTTEQVFNRTRTFTSLIDRIVFFLGRVTSEDFTEVFILGANGHGIGGLKILRGMYERVVTVSYLANHPDKAEAFWKYGPIHKYKLIVHADKAGMNLESRFGKAVLDEIKAERDAVKDQYVDACKKCGATFPMFSWIKGAMDTMVAGSTPELKQMYFHCYYWPTLHDHATVNNIIERMEITPTDDLRWKEDGQRHWVDVAVSSSHWLLITILDLLNTRFALGHDDRINKLAEDWKRSWLKTLLPAA